MLLKKGQLPIVIVGIISMIIFTIVFISRQNYEFLGYVGVLVFFFLLILLTNKKTNFPNYVLWGLLVWALMHMSGGGIFINGKKLYALILINIVGEPYNIFRYDQLVHIVGFGVATMAMFYLIKPKLNLKDNKWVAISIVIVMAGAGVGALNEIVEFTTTVLVPETGVGGYINNSLDLYANLIGAILAMFIIYFKERKHPNSSNF